MKALFAVIASGETVSAVVDARKVNGIEAIYAPAMSASGDLILQGAISTASGTTPPNSGDFCRFLDTRAVGSGDLRFPVGSANRVVPMPGGLLVTTPFLRVEAGVAQTDTRTFTLLTR